MSDLKIQNSNLHYRVYGEGEAIVLAHGVGGNHAIWYKQIAVLSRSYQVIVFDHRGFGLSTDVEGLGRSAYVSDLKALLDYLEIKQAVLIGQSMGGGTCVSFAASYPERVKALVVADSLHAFVETDAVKAIMDHARSTTNDLSQIDRVLGAQFRDANAADILLYGLISGFNKTDRHTLVGQYEKVLAPQDFASLKIPTLFISGMEDLLFPIEAVRLLQSEVPGSFLVEVYEAGHSAFFERPTEFNDSILSFLAMSGVKGLKRSLHSNAPGYAPVKG